LYSYRIRIVCHWIIYGYAPMIRSFVYRAFVRLCFPHSSFVSFRSCIHFMYPFRESCVFRIIRVKRSVRLFEICRTVGPSGQKITRSGNTAKYASPGVRQNFLFVYFVLQRKSEMQLVCRNNHGQLGIRFCFK
jgi:hypothetical protein